MVLVLIPLFSLLQLGAGQWKVLGPKQTIQVWEGQDVTFPCFLSPETNAEAMKVRFFKDYFNAIVFLYQGRKDKIYMQMPQYRGRTELVKDFITNGRVFLKLQKVVPSDTGVYGCWFRSKTHRHEAIWGLEVTVLGSPPLISVMGYVDGGIQLLCQSSGWVSQPIMKWIGPDELELPSDSKVNKDTQGLSDVETSLTVQEDSGSIACSIQHSDHSRVVKSRIWIRNTFFKSSHWLLVSIVFILLCIGGCIWIVMMSITFSKSKDQILKELKEVQDKLDWQKKTET
ncbi:butyrophilin-like protein 8 [Dipodomys merriami]|uniref:butyrophilin-like protein 8 n=1 Tax=Dipodomys merriami TaxID=94247 RepID=UPI003855C6DE